MPKSKKTPEERWKGKFKMAIDLGTLKKHQYDKLSCKDKLSYLDKELRKKYPTRDRQRCIGGIYNCQTCAEIDIFNLDGYQSEEL